MKATVLLALFFLSFTACGPCDPDEEEIIESEAKIATDTLKIK